MKKNIIVYLLIFILGGLSVLAFLEIEKVNQFFDDAKEDEVMSIPEGDKTFISEDEENDFIAEGTPDERMDFFVTKDFSLLIPVGWIVEQVKGRYIISNGDQRFDIFGTSGTYSDSNGKFGKLEISYNAKTECWEVGRSSSKGDYAVVSCVEPDGLISGKPYFAGLGQNGYVLVDLINGDPTFIVFYDQHLSVSREGVKSIFESIEFK